ncbi:MAG TPA: Hpt domain-containing protein, partial [bacterium]|nr:Hpt domain-containing protein [bacterium]
FNSVRENYLTDILEKLYKLETSLFFLSEQKELIEHKDLIYECNRLAHSIKGTGYSFGFKFISEVAFCIEELLAFVLDNFNDTSEKNKTIFLQAILFNDLLIDVIKNYFLKTNEFETTKDYKTKLINLIKITDNILKSNDNNKRAQTAQNQNENEKSQKENDKLLIQKQPSQKKIKILLCGETHLIFNNLIRISQTNNALYAFYYAPGFLDAFYEITNKPIDFIFSEFQLKDFTAIDIYNVLKNTQKYQNIPFYFIVSDFNKLENYKIDSNLIVKKDQDLFKNILKIINANV